MVTLEEACEIYMKDEHLSQYPIYAIREFDEYWKITPDYPQVQNPITGEFGPPIFGSLTPVVRKEDGTLMYLPIPDLMRMPSRKVPVPAKYRK